MALIKCPKCGRSISDKAVNCPKCGAPLHQNLNNWIPQGATNMNVQNPYEYNPNQMPVQNERKSDNSLLIIIIISAFVIILSIIGGFFYIYHNKKMNYNKYPSISEDTCKVDSTVSANTTQTDTTVSQTYTNATAQPTNTSNSTNDNHSLFLEGTIGRYPIVMYWDIDSYGTLSGYYYYKSQGSDRRIPLDGTIDRNGNMSFYEHYPNDDTHHADYTGTFDGSKFYGNFFSQDGSKRYDVNLNLLKICH